MGSLKEYYLEVQEEKEAWIKEKLADQKACESTPGWSEYEYEFYEIKFLENQQSDLDWYSKQTNVSLISNLKNDLNLLREMISPGVIATGFENPLYKMVYAQAVTLLESFLSNSIKSLIVNDKSCLERAIKDVDFIRKPQPALSLLDVWSHPKGIEGIVLSKLSEVLYHNIPKVKQIIEAIIGAKLDIDISKINQVILVRHDIVHRNGITTDDVKLEIDADSVAAAINEIENFATSIEWETFVSAF